VRDAAALPLCLLTRNMQNRRIINAAFRRADVEPRVVVETDSVFALYSNVRCAQMYSILPHSLFAPVRDAGRVDGNSFNAGIKSRIGLVIRFPGDHFGLAIFGHQWKRLGFDGVSFVGEGGASLADDVVKFVDGRDMLLTMGLVD